MEKSGFFADIEGDRGYTDDFLAEWVASFIENGVYNTELGVMAAGDMNITVQPGRAWINGRIYILTEALTIPVEVSDGKLNRYTSIVLRADANARKITVQAVDGTYSAQPTAPNITRNSEIYELKLADIYVAAGAISISQAEITDTRLDNEVCGLVYCPVEHIDTESLYNQIQTDLTNFRNISQKEFDAWFSAFISSANGNISEYENSFLVWFEHMKDQLSEDAAGNLQTQVDNLNNAALGGGLVMKGNPISIEAAGANRIDSLTLYGENAQGGTTEAPVALTGISSVTVNDDVTELPIPRPLRRVGDVRDVCVTRQEYEGTEKLVVTYNVGFVELDGTEASHLYEGMFYLDYTPVWPTPANRVNGVCSHYPYGAYGKGKIGLTDNGAAVVYNPNGDYTGDEGGLANWKAYLAAQKEAGTPVQIAYQLATPEVYATDPVDFDNAAGPLIIMTGGAVEVRMTELIGSRTYDADGDGVVDEAEKVSNALTLKNAAGEVVATFDGSEAAILQLTAALVGALGKTEKAADSSKLAGLTPIIDNPSSTNNRNTWYFPFTGTNNKDGTRKYYAALYADEATRAANKVGGGALVDTNDGRLSNARRASNITMGYDGNLWISYS